MTTDPANVVGAPVNTGLTTYNPQDDFSFMRARDLITPRMLLMQPTSPDVVIGKYRPGSFVVNDAEVLQQGQSMKMLILLVWLQWIEWNPDRNAPQDKRMLNKSFDPMSDLAKQAEAFIKVKNPQGKDVVKVTEYYNCIACLPGAEKNYDNLVAFGFARSSHKEGKKLMNKLMTIKHNGASCFMWENEFLISSRMETKDNNRYFVPTVGAVNRIPDDEFETVKANAEKVRARRIEMMERVANQEVEAEETSASPDHEQAKF